MRAWILTFILVGGLSAGAGGAFHDLPTILTRHVEGDGWMAVNVTIHSGSLMVRAAPTGCGPTAYGFGSFYDASDGPRAWLMGYSRSGGVSLEPPFMDHDVNIHAQGLEVRQQGDICSGGSLGVGYGDVQGPFTTTFGLWLTGDADGISFSVDGSDATVNGVTTGPAHWLTAEDFDGTLRVSASTLVSSHAAAIDTQASFTTTNTTMGYVWGEGDITVDGPAGTSDCPCTWWKPHAPGEHTVNWTSVGTYPIRVSMADVVLPE